MENKTTFLQDVEVAERYDLSRSTIWRWVKCGKFPKPIKLGAHTTRWYLSDLEAWEKVKVSRG